MLYREIIAVLFWDLYKGDATIELDDYGDCILTMIVIANTEYSVPDMKSKVYIAKVIKN
jgi:hypothetical protein